MMYDISVAFGAVNFGTRLIASRQLVINAVDSGIGEIDRNALIVDQVSPGRTVFRSRLMNDVIRIGVGARLRRLANCRASVGRRFSNTGRE